MTADQGRFVNDFYEEGMYVGLVVRSSIPRGQILSISYPTLPNGMTLITADAIPGRNELSILGGSMPVLASQTVGYLGEPILLLCGADERDLQAFAAAIEIRYFEEPPLRFDSPVPEQWFCDDGMEHGEVDKVLAEAFQVVEGEYSTSPGDQVASDAHGAVAQRTKDRFQITTPTQWPFHVRETVAAVLGLPADRVNVAVSAMSAHKDSRIWFSSLLAAHAALLADASGKIVKLVLQREEAARVVPRRASSRIQIRTGLDKDGIPTAQDIHIYLDGGAYPLMAGELLDRAILGTGGVYRAPNVRLSAHVVRTSGRPMGAFLGLGLAQGAFASETHASRIAELSQTDPFTWKRDNLITTGDNFAGGGTPASYPPEQLLRRAAELSDFRRKHAAYEMLKKRRDTIRERTQTLRGIGISIAFQGAGLHGKKEEDGSYGVTVRLEADGKLHILTSGVSIDGVARKQWQDSAWRILGIERKNIICRELPTNDVPDSGPSAFSRNVTIIDILVARCCQTIARRRFRSGLPIEVRRTYRIPRANRWSQTTKTGLPFPMLSWAAAVVETEVDPVTFETEIRGIWMPVACGELLNPANARRTVENAIFHALWWCSSTYGSSREPKIDNLPPIEVEFITPETRSVSGGVEELAGSVIPSAYVSAVAQATGRYFDSLPITPELIHHYTEDM